MPVTRLHFTARRDSGNDRADREHQYTTLLDFAWQAMLDGVSNRAWVFCGVNRDGRNVMGLVLSGTEAEARQHLASLSPALGLHSVCLPSDVPNDGCPFTCLTSAMDRGQMHYALHNLCTYLPVLNPSCAA